MDELIKWKNNKDRKPLILKGIRQCGKTYLLREFGEKYYTDIAYFNFEGNESLQDRFERDLDCSRIIEELSILRGKPIKKEETLIIFDEIQFCNKALSSLKYFCENMPGYHIVSAGSLLGIALSKPLPFPVGKVYFLTLYPMSFYEFLLANGEDMLCEYLQELPNNEVVSALFTDKLENYLRSYYITGGMPEVVDKWVKTKDISLIEDIQKKILDSYELDFAKHAPIKDYPKLSLIWKSIPNQLSRENNKFMYSNVKKGLRGKDLEDALQWLISAGLVYRVSRIEKPFIPLEAHADQVYFKLYMPDIGLLRKVAGLPAGAILEKNNLFTEFKGALTENYVLCELIKINNGNIYYWKSQNIAEVDFVIGFGTKIIPIEVKSERNTKSRSLTEYRKRYNPEISLLISMNNISGEKIKNIPLYLLWKIKDYCGG